MFKTDLVWFPSSNLFQRLFDRNVVPPHWLLASSLFFPLINSTLVVGRCDFGYLFRKEYQKEKINC